MIEKIFIISLPERLIDRLIPLIDYLKSIDMSYWAYQATKNTNGKLGLLLTMEKLLTESMYAEFEQILVLEDDCNFIVDDVKEQIEKCLLQLPKDFDCLYLGVNLFQKNVELYSENLIKLESGYATHAIIYSKKGIRKVLEAIRSKKLNQWALDEIMVKLIQPQGSCFAAYPMVVTQSNGYSDIEKKEIKYDRFLTDRFKERTAHLKKNLVNSK